MNKKMITYVLGILLITEGALLLLPTLIALYYKENVVPFLITIAATVASGFVMTRFKPHDKTIVSMDGFAIVSLGWILISLFGALPFFISKEIPNYLDAVFEVVSGFTTTGSSILTDVEALSKGMLFWRSFTHWIGGMGVLVFLLAIIPLSGGSNFNLMRAESPGPSVGKLVPKIKTTARLLYIIYIGMTFIEIILLIAGQMPIFDAITTSFGTAGTGGFGIKNDSIMSYSPYIQWVVTIFMILFGVNFNAYYFILLKQWKKSLLMEEVRYYFIIIGISTAIIFFNILNLFSNAFDALRHATFQVGSIITTTGFSSVDFDIWPETSKIILVLLMFIGACSGSTGGGIKVSRIMILIKTVVKELNSYIHPRSVRKIKIDGKPVEHDVVRATNVYFITFMVIFAFSVFAISFENIGLVTSFTAVTATINNIGPGLELVGPTQNFSVFGPFSKYVLMFDMLAGRLELFPLLLLFHPSVLKDMVKKSNNY